MSRTSVSLAVSIALGSCIPTAQAQDDVEEIIVTARKRAENLQDIPASVMAITSDEIDRAILRTMEDYARKIPSLSYAAWAPGSNKIVFRGVTEAGTAIFTDSSAALYLDEYPLTHPYLMPEPRLIDIERVEALSGPQGTLFGSSAQSGTLRILTREPDTGEFAAEAHAMVRTGEDADPSYEVSGMVNLPLIEDKFALRLVGFSAEDGGFIDNVLAPSSQGTFDNADVVNERQGGQASYLGARVSARWTINPRWSATARIVQQDVESDGDPWHSPGIVGDLEQVRFVDETREDRWTLYGLTVEGDLGFARLISATSYYDRETHYFVDNTDYLNVLRAYYTSYPSYFVAYAFGPDPRGLGIVNDQEMSRFTQELRLDGGNDTWEWIAGIFYDDNEDQWDYRSTVADYEDTNSFAFFETVYGAVPGTTEDAWWHSANYMRTKEFAVFGELTYTIAEDWAFTAGARWFDHERNRRYTNDRPLGRQETDLNPVQSEQDTTFKVSASYRLTDDKMVYALYSEGYRNGGRNILREGAVLPAEYNPDFLQNYELGLRSLWFDGRLTVNATAYHMTWDDYQLGVVDPGPLFAVMVVNAGNAELNGFEIDISATPVDGFELQVNALTGSAETTSDNEFLGIGAGARLPIAPDFKASASLQYMWSGEIAGGYPYGRLDYSYHSDSLNFVECNTENCFPAGVQGSYAITDLNFGLDAGNWDARIFVRNVFDERAPLAIIPGWPFGSVVVNRPREVGIGFSYAWGR